MLGNQAFVELIYLTFPIGPDWKNYYPDIELDAREISTVHCGCGELTFIAVHLEPKTFRILKENGEEYEERFTVGNCMKCKKVFIRRQVHESSSRTRKGT